MTAPAVTTDGRPIVGAYGDVYTAPANTPPPTDLDTPGSPWVKLGLISEDGATWTLPTEEQTDIKAWQSPFPVRKVTTSLDTSVNFALMEWDRDTLPFALGGGTFTETSTPAPGIVTFHPPKAGEAASKAIFVYVKDGTIEFGIYYAQGRVTERGDATFKPDEAALMEITFGIEVTDPLADPYQLLFKKDTFATGIVKGAAEPGDVFPAEATVTASDSTNAAKLGPLGYVALPLTAWLTGQKITVGAFDFNWSGSAWAAGAHA
jgi:hypothetical protein